MQSKILTHASDHSVPARTGMQRVAAYNPCMVHATSSPLRDMGSSLGASVSQSMQTRLTLVLNHLIAAEPAATARLQPHADQSIDAFAPLWALPPFVPWPRDAANAPRARWRISAAGLLESIVDDGADVGAPAGFDAAAPGASSDASREPSKPRTADARIHLRADSPRAVALAWASGDAAVFEVEGREDLAADLRWVLANVRWDVGADVQHLLGVVGVVGSGGAVAAGVAESALERLKGVVRAIDAWRPSPTVRSRD
jgi:ubiquinone biosynthesis accessory factor UbiJ